MKKLIAMNELSKYIKSGMTIMFSGFMGCGNPIKIIDYMIENNIRDITLICNDTSFDNVGVGKLVSNGHVKKVIASHIGLNKNTGKFMNEGTLEVELIPQGTLAERIHCGGAGLGGVLVPTGLDTMVEEGKQKIIANGKEFLLELPLKADVALIGVSVCDKFGNSQYLGTSRNFGPIMAMAADVVIVEAEKIIETGEMDPSFVHTPGVLVDYIVGEV